MAIPSTTSAEGPWFIAEQSALDFINTQAWAEQGTHDFWHSDEDVKSWLQQSGLGKLPETFIAKPGELLAEARKLRALILQLVEEKKSGHTPSLVQLNHYLAQAQSYLQVNTDAEGALQIQRLYQQDTPLRALAPVAEQAAELITHGQFEYVRQCEHPECILWFYDRTKAHRRRWCSMALCGNRAKVARFRAKS